jgi:hypothetical protein
MAVRWRWLAGGIALVLLGAAGRAGLAQSYLETFEGKAPEEVFGGVLALGQEGAWRAALEDGAYVLENRGEPGAIRYFWLGKVPGHEGVVPAELPVSVEVDGDFADDLAGPGLIFRFDPDQRFYYAFALFNHGRYGVLQRDAEGVHLRHTDRSTAIRPDGPNRLSIEPDGATMRFLINGEAVAAFDHDASQGTGVGILAIGSGRFTFDNFAIGRLKAGGAGSDRSLRQLQNADWVEHRDPAGFAIDHPPGWRLTGVDGQVRLAGPAGELVAIWPFVVRAPVAAAAGLLVQLADSVAPELAWQPPAPLGSDTWRTLGQAGERRALASLTLRPAGVQTFGTLYLIAGPETALRQQAATFERILASFRPLAGESAAPAGPRLDVTRFADPAEHAFSLDVPAGWQIDGGTHRLHAVDLRQFVHARSPDGAIWVFLGDPEIPPFTLPSAQMQGFGFVEGGWYSPSPGVNMLIRRYLPGAAFAQEYVGWRLGGALVGLRFDEVRERADIVATQNRLAQQYQVGDIASQSDAGEVTFTGTAGGMPVRGYALAGTSIVTMPMMGEQSGVWNVTTLLGFVASEERAVEAGAILAHMIQSFEWNLDWVRGQQHLTMEAARVHRETSEYIAGVINDVYANRQASQDEMARRFSNYLTEQVDVVDPASGESFKVESGANYYWIDAFRSIVGTELYANPDPMRLREMVQLP